ncbi:MAG: DUF1540 domain-containing protein [Nitrospirota bacterium]
MEIPKVLACSVNECAFNSNKECRALAINVGGHHPACDTFTNHGHKAGGTENMGVGACKVDHCKFNKSLMCSAPGITVGHHEHHADCKTYIPAS